MTIQSLIQFPVMAFVLLALAGPGIAGGEVMPPPQASLTLPGSEAVKPVELRWVDGWVLARVRINSAEAGWFKIAGWEQSCIDPTVARRLKLREVPVFGMLNEHLREGGDVGGSHWFRADVFECGGARGGDVKVEEYDMTQSSKLSLARESKRVRSSIFRGSRPLDVRDFSMPTRTRYGRARKGRQRPASPMAWPTMINCRFVRS